MSKFAEKLQHIYRSSTSSIGFRKPAEEKVSRMLVVADLTKTGISQAKVIADNIDAGIVSDTNLDTRNLEQLVAAVDGIPVGLFLEGGEHNRGTKLIDSGCDFVVFDLKTPFEVVAGEGVGRVLKVEPSLDPGLVRAINALPLPVDGVLVNIKDSLLTVELLLTCQRFADLLDKPLLLYLDSLVSGNELKSLSEVGVEGLVLSAGLPADTSAKLRKLINGLPRVTKRNTRGSALIPQLGSQAEVDDDEEEV